MPPLCIDAQARSGISRLVSPRHSSRECHKLFYFIFTLFSTQQPLCHPRSPPLTTTATNSHPLTHITIALFDTGTTQEHRFAAQTNVDG